VAFVVIAFAMDEFQWLEPAGEVGVFHVHRPGRGVLPAALVAWIAWKLSSRAVNRTLGKSRSRHRDGMPWWRDRAWSMGAVTRRIDEGLPRTSSYVAWTIAAGIAYCACCFAVIGNTDTKDAELILRWVPTHWSIAVATCVLPVAFLALVVGPRLLRGRLAVSWPTFPQFTGGRCAFDLRTSSARARIDGVRVFLRCVQTRRRPIPILPGWRDRLVWVAEARLPLNACVGAEETQRAEFDVPASAPATDLHADDAVRWELLVLGTVGAADYADAVVVPVYAPR